MGFLGRVLHTEKQHAALDPASPAAARLEQHRAALDAFAHRLHDKLEIVPGDRGPYVFIGRPPDAFGIAWFVGGEEHNFKRALQEKGVSQEQVRALSDELRQAYLRARDEPRFAWTIGGKHVLVTPSATLEREVAEIVDRVAG
jgi:hypothetical protein